MNLILLSNFIIEDQLLSLGVASKLLEITDLNNHIDNLNDKENIKHPNNGKNTEINWDWFKSKDGNNSNTEKFINKQQIIIFNSKSKENLSQNLISLYVKYNEPTWLILGNLSEISNAMQQGLLRFIEEPPQNLNIILTARSKSDILSTITSRCEIKPIPSFVSFNYINKEKNDELTSAFQSPKDFLQILLQNRTTNPPEFKNVSRDGLETWLWQLEYLTSQVILKNGSSDRLEHIFENILEAKELNQANVLNRLIWAQLFV
jgi:hypothetical protein